MPKWSMVIDLDKCVACQGCSIACRMENNTPAAPPDQAAMGREIRWNDVFPWPPNQAEPGEYPHVKTYYMTRPCQHCENPPCIKVCPVQATYKGEEGIVHQNYSRCIGCRFCTVACPYGVRYFNWYAPEWDPTMRQHLNPDRVESGEFVQEHTEGPIPRPKGVVEKCTFCVQRHDKALKKAAEEGRALRDSDYIPACVQTCTGKARYFGDMENPESTVSLLAQERRAFRLLEEVGTFPKVIYLREG
ncbi:MAG: 4Fe-4S dicluster domain-containing protein [Chloroflexi bacterium]|nr:4Fe-4S dicluster domain-containing protein [Chloroflexota bacterium]